MVAIIVIAVIVGVLLFLVFGKKNYFQTSNFKKVDTTFPTEWRTILIQKVTFYHALSPVDKGRFEKEVHYFIANYRITGINTTVETVDKILVAASAVIPIFGFDNWHYTHLYEVLLYPSAFNEKFETAGAGRSILGMVGTGYMEGKMILSKQALHHGFSNETDKKNTAIHEFVHLIDKADGTIDGIPEALLEKQYAIPWLDLINKKMDEIYADTSDINPYGGTNREEFFAVTSEYFFERPKMLSQKHPELYGLLKQVFDQDMAAHGLNRKKHSIGRNSPCPCNSGKKFKNCCGSLHYN